MRLTAARRLRAASEFSRVREQGRAQRGKFVIVSVLPLDDSAPWRCGIITSRKVGCAVERNTVRRRLREIIRAAPLRDGFWIVTIARWQATQAAFDDLSQDWLRAAKRAGILQEADA